MLTFIYKIFFHQPIAVYINCCFIRKKFKIVEEFIKKAQFGIGEKITIDGLRVNFDDGWGLLRASNTTPKLVLRFEANSRERLNEIQDIFLDQLKTIDETINIKLS